MNALKQQEAPKLHQYVDCGLNNVWLEGGFDDVESPYGPGIAIHDMEGLHRCIAQCLVQRPGPLTGSEFRFLRTELDLSQYAMGVLCGRNARTIRKWETEDEVVEEPANTIIRHVYDQRTNPSDAKNYEERSKLIQQFQAVDKQLHETKLKIKELKLVLKAQNGDGWKVETCPQSIAA
jgi:DNA-binding transcriptional regulator YiaG